MEETFDKVNYADWDKDGFSIPPEFILSENSFLHEAISVFYQAGGYDFFKVKRPEKYASRWLEFMGNLYSEITSGRYKTDGKYHENKLDEDCRKSLAEQGVPEIFLR